jgi:phosphoglycerate dehydrogenase-like enzyme
MSPPLAALIAYHQVDPELARAKIKAVDPAVQTIVCDYENSHDVRVQRELRPLDPNLRDLVPGLNDEQRHAFAQADVALCLDVPLDLGEVAPRLKWVQNIGSGVGQYVSSRLTDAGIRLTNAAGISAPGIAEFVFARILEHWKLLPRLRQMQDERSWKFAFGRRVEGSTIAIVGMGAIGREVARLADSFGMYTIATKRNVGAAAPIDFVREIHPASDLKTVLGRADVVVVCATGSGENDGLIGAAEFASMAPGSLFINVARGNLVDEQSLCAALRSGHLGAAAIDVTREEPLSAGSPLWDTPNLRLSPHSSSTQDGYIQRVVDLFCDNLTRFISGQPLRNEVDLGPLNRADV